MTSETIALPWGGMSKLGGLVAIAWMLGALACAADNHTHITTDALPSGVTIDGWKAGIENGGSASVAARIHNGSPLVLTSVSVEATFRDCEIPVAGRGPDMGIQPEPDGFDGLSCEIVGHEDLTFLSPNFSLLAIPAGEARDVVAHVIRTSIPHRTRHRLFWSYTPKLVIAEDPK